MTSYVTITDGEIDPESPITTTLMTKMRDNAIAIAEGTSPAPSVDKAVGANRVHLVTKTASASASLDFTTEIDGTYDRYEFDLIDLVPATNAVLLYTRLSINDGSAWLTTGYDHSHDGITSGATINTGQATADSKIIIAGALSSNADYPMNGSVKINGLTDTRYHSVAGETWFKNSTNDANKVQFIGQTALVAANAIQFYYSSGNMASGRIALYGIRSL